MYEDESELRARATLILQLVADQNNLITDPTEGMPCAASLLNARNTKVALSINQLPEARSARENSRSLRLQSI